MKPTNVRPLTCVRCGAPIPSGHVCASCAAPPARVPTTDDPAPSPPRSDAPRLLLCALLLVLVVAASAVGVRKGLANVAEARAAAARREADRAAAIARRKAAQEAARQASAAPSPAPIAHAPAAPTYAPIQPPSESSALPPPTTDPAAGLAPPSTPAPIVCSSCGGTGTVDEPCGACDDGVAECEHCADYHRRLNRGGDPNCPECGGTSRLVSAVGTRLYGITFVYPCRKCHGDGTITTKCRTCYGRGTL